MEELLARTVYSQVETVKYANQLKDRLDSLWVFLKNTATTTPIPEPIRQTLDDIGHTVIELGLRLDLVEQHLVGLQNTDWPRSDCAEPVLKDATTALAKLQ